MSNDPLRIIPLGGLGEVGKNMMVYEYDGDILVVDAGIMFPENDMLGVDYIIPDYQYLIQRREKVRGIVITHGHEDHLGAVHHLLQDIQVPVYATALTMGLLEVKLGKHGLAQKALLHTIKAGESAQIGAFEVEFFHVCHSIPDCIGLGINTPQGLIIHSGDYKFDHTPVDNWPSDYAKLAEFSRRGVLALLGDSTNAENAGWTPSERVVDAALDDVFRETKGRIIVASFASLVSRMQQVFNAAVKNGRKIVFVGVSMVDNMKIARKLGYLDVDDAFIIPIDQANGYPDKEIVIMCTGSQGEPASILGRLSAGTNRQFEIRNGDTVILSSHPIPGNEENIYRTINRLIQRGADVIHEGIAPVHVSGHASREEMKLLIHLVKPEYVIPVHGELRHLKQHAMAAKEVGIPEDKIAVIENGQVVEFSDRKMSLRERVPGSYVFVDGSGVGKVGMDVMRERETLAQDGVIFISISISKITGRIMSEPNISSKGFMASSEAPAILEPVAKKLKEILARGNAQMPSDIEQILKSVLYSETRRRPVVMVSINNS